MKLSIEPEASLLLTHVASFLTKQGKKSYLVGGFVRDVLLGRETADIDIAVFGDVLEIAPKLADALGGRYVLLDEINGVGRVVVDGGRWQLDFTTAKDSIEHNLAQRDFTLDALAIDLSQLTKGADFQLIDPFSGLDDLEQGIIRAVSETAFSSDAVRLLRAVRLAGELGFDIDKETESQIRRHCHLLDGVAGERIREELLRLLAISGAGKYLAYLDELGLLTVIIPELSETKGVPQPKEHCWDVFDHSLKTVIAADFLLGRGGWEYAGDEVLALTPWSPELERHFTSAVSQGSTRGSLLKLAALLHDISKPETKTIEADGRVRFLGHTKEGAARAVSILERLRFSGKEARLVEVMVAHHLRPTQMSSNGLPTRRAIYRYFRDTDDAGVDILFLSLADHLATRGSRLKLAEWRQHAKLVNYVLNQRFKEESVVTPPKLVDGHDLINVFDISPGPRIGQLLEAVREAQAGGEVKTKEEALAYIRGQLVSEARK
ncbi:MAG: HD domain-containing protein [Dehalococcoidia bacterium]|nr:MAG: HD domain-containing protein [Dehalococcoidia bacterium]